MPRKSAAEQVVVELHRVFRPSAGVVVHESTGRCHRDFEEALAGRLPLARVNATRGRRFAQAMGQQAKTNAADARVLAAMGVALRLRRTEARSWRSCARC